MFGTVKSDVSPAVQDAYDRNMLERGAVALIHGRYLQKANLPANSGERTTLRRFNALPVNTVPIAELGALTGKKASIQQVYITAKPYGDFIPYSEWLSMTSLDKVLYEFSGILGDQAGLTVDTLDRAFLNAGTSIRYANGVAGRSTVVTAIATSDLKAAVRILEAGLARPVSSKITAGRNVATVPVPPAFRGITHLSNRQNLEALPDFVKVQNFASDKGVTAETIGSWGNIIFEATTNAKIFEDAGEAVGASGLVTSGTKVDVYTTLIMGENAAGSLKFGKAGIKNIINATTKGGVGNELQTIGSTGWKTVHGGSILNEDNIIRIEHGITDL